MPSPRVFLFGAADDIELALNDDTLEPGVVHEFARLGALFWYKAEHGREEGRDEVRLVLGKEVFVVQDLLQRPEAQLLDVPQLP